MEQLIHDSIYDMRLIVDEYGRKLLIHRDDNRGETRYPAAFICKRVKPGFCSRRSDIIKPGDRITSTHGSVYEILDIIRNTLDLAWFQTWYPASEMDRLQIKLALDDE